MRAVPRLIGVLLLGLVGVATLVIRTYGEAAQEVDADHHGRCHLHANAHGLVTAFDGTTGTTIWEQEALKEEAAGDPTRGLDSWGQRIIPPSSSPWPFPTRSRRPTGLDSLPAAIMA